MKRLTLDLGLPFTNYTPLRDDNGATGLAVWNPALFQADNTAGSTQPGLRWHSISPNIPNAGSPTKWALIDPRFGVAWDAFGSGRTIFRGGWGAYHFHDSFNDFAGALSSASGSRPFHTSQTTLALLQTANSAFATGAFAVNPTDDEHPVTYTYNFTISQQAPWKSLFEIAYVGNHSSHLTFEGNGTFNFMNINVIPMGALFTKDRVSGVTFAPANAAQANVADFRPFGTYLNGAGFGDNSLQIGTKGRSEEHTSELQSPDHLVCRLLLEKKKTITNILTYMSL